MVQALNIGTTYSYTAQCLIVQLHSAMKTHALLLQLVLLLVLTSPERGCRISSSSMLLPHSPVVVAICLMRLLSAADTSLSSASLNEPVVSSSDPNPGSPAPLLPGICWLMLPGELQLLLLLLLTPAAAGPCVSRSSLMRACRPCKPSAAEVSAQKDRATGHILTQDTVSH